VFAYMCGGLEAKVLEELRRELDSLSEGAQDKCVRACGVLLEAEQEPLLRAVGWDLLHSFLPFAAVAGCADHARRLLLRAATVCNAREMFSMVMEALVLFQV
jgi:hypothetical protein